VVVAACPGTVAVPLLRPRFAGMAIDTTIEQAQLDLETAHGQFTALQLAANVSDDTKLLAAAIAQAGAEIALAIAQAAGVRPVR
jgi:hypothetical protein